MKIKNLSIKNKKNLLIHLQIIQSKFFSENFDKKKLNKSLDNIKLYWKKIVNLIFEYHVNNKNILFLNFPEKFKIHINNLIWNTNHTAKDFQTIINKNKFEICFDLIIVFNKDINLERIFNYFSYVPLIIIDSDLNNSKHIYNYKISGNFEYMEHKKNNLLYSLLRAIFNRIKINKKNNLLKKLKSKIVKKKWKWDPYYHQKKWNKYKHK